ncbi:MAG: DJ-1/PfpI family protein [Planctomycetes bacterium]|nr:DJ-1/PfpI family protein [Planctomycetota bacterium]
MSTRAKVLVPLAEGFEEIEVAAIVDVLRRAQLEVTTAGLKPGPVRGAHGITFLADTVWSDVDPEAFDVLVLPGGGPGTQNLAADPRILDAVRRFEATERRVAAICAAPTVLHAAGILAGRSATAYPSVRATLRGVDLVEDRPVVRDGRVTTSQGPGTAIAFALDLVAQLAGDARAAQLARDLIAR